MASAKHPRKVKQTIESEPHVSAPGLAQAAHQGVQDCLQAEWPAKH
jgi:hypothetical protein